MDTLSHALEFLRYISESTKEMQSNRFSMEWTVYISLISFFAISAGFSVSSKYNPGKLAKWAISIALLAVGAMGILFVINTQYAHNKNQKMYSEADKRSMELLIESKILKPNDIGILDSQYKTDRRSRIGTNGTAFLLCANLLLFTGGAILVIISQKGKRE